MLEVFKPKKKAYELQWGSDVTQWDLDMLTLIRYRQLNS